MKKNLIYFLFLFLFLLIPEKIYATEGSLSCQPSTGTYKVGDTFTVDYILDTRGYQIFGADVVATYTTSIIQPVGTQSTAVTSVTNWTAPTTNSLDSTLGKIELNYGSAQAVFTSSTTIGQMTFRALAAGQAQFVYTFMQSKDNTTPGVAKVWGKPNGTDLENVLTDVNNCIYVIEGSVTSTPSPTVTPGGPTLTSAPTATSAPAAPTATSAPGVPSSTISELPRTGSMEQTMSLIGLSGVFIVLGTILPAFISRRRI